MYPVSAAYKNVITKDVRDVKITGTLTLKDNTVISITDKDILQGSLYITEQCVSGEDIEVGNVYAAEMGLTLTTPLDNPYRLDGARILLNYGIDVSEDGSGLWEYVPLGYFYVTDIARKLNNVTLTAFDGMILFDVDVGDPGSRSPRNFVVHACNRAGITLGTSIAVIDALPNARVLLAAPDTSKVKTARDLLMWACQIMGSFARMNRQGQLEIVPVAPRERVKAIEKRERFTSEVSDFAVRITRVSMQVGETLYSRGADGATMILEENPLLIGLNDAQIRSILDNILAQITQVIYVPFKSDFMGDPALQPGDFIDIRDAGILESETYFFSAAAPLEVHVDIIRSMITHSTWRYRGSHNIRGTGKSGIIRGAQNQQIKAVSSVIAVARAAKDLALSANQSTQLIKDAIAGNILIREGPEHETNEILIMDHPEPEQATKIWRWNMGGLAYSDNVTGADNPDREYTDIAITMDGAINANFIKTGQLDAGVVKIGPQTTFEEGYDPTELEMFNPGYVTADTEGIKVYDASNDLRVLLGSWLKDAVRKYGLKIIGGEIYSSLISTGEEGTDSGVIKIRHYPQSTYPQLSWGAIDFHGGSGKKIMSLDTGAQQPALRIFDEQSESQVSAGFFGLGVGSSTREIYVGAYDRGILLSSSGESIAMGATSGQTGQRGVAISGIRGDLSPYVDGGGNLGASDRRWWMGYIVYTQTGDLAFSEKTCAICDGRFEDGDILALLTKTILDNGYTFTIPVHEKCKSIQKELEVEVPEMVTKYKMNDQGKLEEYNDVYFEEIEEEIITVHPDYELDEDTGRFKRKMNDWNLELFDEKEILAGVMASERVAKVRDNVITKKPKLKKIQIKVGQNK